MLRIVTLAAVAAVLGAAPASAESIRIATAGKTPDQVKAEVVKAAAELCRAEVGDATLAHYMQGSCIRATVSAALSSPEAARMTYAQR
jgi:hypothetical protein